MVPGKLDVKGTRILAKSLFKELRGNGYSPNQILNLSTELIDLVTQDLRVEHAGEVARDPVLGTESGAWRAAM
jgi:broad-specificity NMP kinase